MRKFFIKTLCYLPFILLMNLLAVPWACKYFGLTCTAIDAYTLADWLMTIACTWAGTAVALLLTDALEDRFLSYRSQ